MATFAQTVSLGTGEVRSNIICVNFPKASKRKRPNHHANEHQFRAITSIHLHQNNAFGPSLNFPMPKNTGTALGGLDIAKLLQCRLRNRLPPLLQKMSSLFHYDRFWATSYSFAQLVHHCQTQHWIFRSDSHEAFPLPLI